VIGYGNSFLLQHKLLHVPLNQVTMIFQRSAVVAALLLATGTFGPHTTDAFVPSTPRNLFSSSGSNSITRTVSSQTDPTLAAGKKVISRRQHDSTALQMAAEDFDQMKYTEAAWAAISALTKVADYYRSNNVESVHLLDVMLNPQKHNAGEDADSSKRALEKVLALVGVDTKELRMSLEEYLGKQPKIESASTQKNMGQTFPKVLEAARQIKSNLGDSFVSTEALILALAKEDFQFTSKALDKQNVSFNDLLKVVKEMRGKQGAVISRSAENMYDALLKYGIDFTERAEQGKLDPVIGRDDEIRRAIQILSRRTK
jgi:ATP-dependent Clp protease ATP-binding subunit ClpB